MEIVEPVGIPSRDSDRRAKQNLFPLVGGQAASLFGDYIAVFTLPYFMLSLTGEAFDLGLTGAAETLPMLLFGLAAGVFLDRRRRLGFTLIGTDLVRAGVFMLLAFGAHTGLIPPMAILAAAFVTGSMGVLFDSGLQIYMTRSLRTEDLIKANAQLGLARTISLSIGPLVGGVIVALAGGFALAFGMNAITFLVSAVLLSFVRPITSIASEAHEPFMRAMRTGVRILFADKRLRWGTLGGTVTNLVFQPLEALLVMFVAVEVLGLENLSEGLAEAGALIGLFFGAQAAIASVGVVFAGKLAKRIPLGTMYILGLAMLGFGFLAVAIMGNWYAVIPAGVAITGVTWANIAFVTMRQQLTPPEHMGRVIAASRTFAWAGLPIGAAAGGWMAGVVGIVPVYIVGSSSVVIVALLLMRTALYKDRVMAGSAG
ncbi:MAG: MFS transporter [Actinomycetota bacterium]|nr:MFS transporter [Actinomycetota bacterium]